MNMTMSSMSLSDKTLDQAGMYPLLPTNRPAFGYDRDYVFIRKQIDVALLGQRIDVRHKRLRSTPPLRAVAFRNNA